MVKNMKEIKMKTQGELEADRGGRIALVNANMSNPGGQSVTVSGGRAAPVNANMSNPGGPESVTVSGGRAALVNTNMSNPGGGSVTVTGGRAALINANMSNPGGRSVTVSGGRAALVNANVPIPGGQSVTVSGGRAALVNANVPPPVGQSVTVFGGRAAPVNGNMSNPGGESVTVSGGMTTLVIANMSNPGGRSVTVPGGRAALVNASVPPPVGQSVTVFGGRAAPVNGNMSNPGGPGSVTVPRGRAALVNANMSNPGDGSVTVPGGRAALVNGNVSPPRGPGFVTVPRGRAAPVNTKFNVPPPGGPESITVSGGRAALVNANMSNPRDVSVTVSEGRAALVNANVPHPGGSGPVTVPGGRAAPVNTNIPPPGEPECATVPGGMGPSADRSQRLEDIRRGAKGFCRLEQMAKVHWRTRPTGRRTDLGVHWGRDGPHMRTHGIKAFPSDLKNYGSTPGEFQKEYKDPGGIQKENKLSGENMKEPFPSVLRMLQSPRPWGESVRGGIKWGQSVSTSNIFDKLQVSSSGKGTELKRASNSDLSSYKSSEVVLANGNNCKVHRARYCLLPASSDMASSTSVSSFGSHQGHFNHRATLVVPSVVKRACFTMTHLSSDNGLLHVIKPPPGTPLPRNTLTPTPGASTSSRETLHTPAVLSRLDKILQGPEDLLSGLHRSTIHTTSPSEAPTAGSQIGPDLRSLQEDLGEDGVIIRTEDLEDALHPALSHTSFPRLDNGHWREVLSREMVTMFPAVVRLSRVPLPRSYDLQDPVEVATFLEHLPSAFPNVVAKCELWFLTWSDRHYSLAL